MTSLELQAARLAEVPELVALELRAGQLFHQVGMSEVADHAPDEPALRNSVEDGLVWIARDDGRIAGYVSAEVVDENAHVAQVSVSPDHARRGVGRILIEHVEAWGREAARPATTLTTFRDVPWNGPYYRRLGYRELADSEIGPELAATMAVEATFPGIDAALRCATVKANR